MIRLLLVLTLFAAVGCTGQFVTRQDIELNVVAMEREGFGGFVSQNLLTMGANDQGRSLSARLKLDLQQVPTGSTVIVTIGDDILDEGMPDELGNYELSFTPRFRECSNTGYVVDAAGGCYATMLIQISMRSAPSGIAASATLRLINASETEVDATMFTAFLRDDSALVMMDGGVDGGFNDLRTWAPRAMPVSTSAATPRGSFSSSLHRTKLAVDDALS